MNNTPDTDTEILTTLKGLKRGTVVELRLPVTRLAVYVEIVEVTTGTESTSAVVTDDDGMLTVLTDAELLRNRAVVV